MKMTDNSINILCYFIFKSIAVRNRQYDTFPKNLKFVFNLEDINLFENLIKNKVKRNVLEIDDRHSYYLYNQDIENVLFTLRKNLSEYLNNKDESTHYIYVDDTVKFADLLNRLSKSLNGEYDENGYEFNFSILGAIWLRMSASEFDDIYKFLEHQILFNENKHLTVPKILSEDYNKKTYVRDLKNYKICYKVKAAGTWYETNKKISIFIENDTERSLLLPEVYFQIIDNGSKKTCYIYAIQTSKDERLNENKIIEESLIDIKRQLRNKYVNYKFVLALKFFIEILRKNDIYDIKVPLLQLFSYDYHISMSEEYKRRMNYLENEVREGRLTYDSSNYEYIKKIFDKVADKQDIISKNKTERLIGTFMVLEEKFDIINILSEPFIEDENLIVKVLESPINKSFKKKNLA